MKKTILTTAIILAAAVAGSMQAENAPIRLNLGVSTWAADKYPHVFNTITTQALNSTTDISPLKNVEGEITSLQAEVTDDFSGVAANGPDTFTAENGWEIVNPESRTYLFGVGGPGRLSTGALVNPTAEVTLSGLDTELVYNIYVLCSMGKKGGTSDGKNRETVAIVKGLEEKRDSVDATYNTSFLEYRNVQPAADGTVKLAFRAGANNNAVATSKGLPVEEQGLVCKDFYVNEVIIEKAAPPATGLHTAAAAESLRVTTEGITVLAADGLTQLRVIDLHGKAVFLHSALHDGLHIPLHFLTPGVFLVQTLDRDGSVYTEKIMKR